MTRFIGALPISGRQDKGKQKKNGRKKRALDVLGVSDPHAQVGGLFSPLSRQTCRSTSYISGFLSWKDRKYANTNLYSVDLL